MKLLRSVVGVARLECVRNEAIRVKRRRDMWREKMTENEGSLVNSNEWKRCRRDLEDCAASL